MGASPPVLLAGACPLEAQAECLRDIAKLGRGLQTLSEVGVIQRAYAVGRVPTATAVGGDADEHAVVHSHVCGHHHPAVPHTWGRGGAGAASLT